MFTLEPSDWEFFSYFSCLLAVFFSYRSTYIFIISKSWLPQNSISAHRMTTWVGASSQVMILKGWRRRQVIKSCDTYTHTYTQTHTYTRYRLLIKFAIGMWTCLVLQCCAAQCVEKIGQSLPGECFIPGEADDYAIIVSLSEKTILGKAHNFSFLPPVCGSYCLSSSSTVWLVFCRWCCVSVVIAFPQKQNGFDFWPWTCTCLHVLFVFLQAVFVFVL